MRTYIITLVTCFLAFPVLLSGQGNPLDSFMQKYAHEEGFYYVDLKTNMLTACDSGSTSAGDRVVEMKLLSYHEQSGSGMTAADIYDAFVKSNNLKDYIGLMEVKHSGEHVDILVRKEDGIVSNFIITVREDQEVTLLAASGNFDLLDLANLKMLQKCKGLKMIGQMCEE